MAEMFSVESYPDPYCEIVDGMATACLEMSILELWANDGAFDDRTEREPDILILKHACSILRQSYNPVCGSWKSQANSPWAKQHRV